MAEKSGNLLFAETRGDDYINTVELSDGDIIKISLNFTDADVNIYGSSSTSYIEFVNFRETLYSLSVSNTSVSFSESPNFSSILRFWESGFTFKGMRHLFSPRTYDDSRMKAINIYLSSDCEIKQLDITADTMTVSLENLPCAADYVLNAKEIDFYASSVKTNSSLRINTGGGVSPAERASVQFKSSSFTNIMISANDLTLDGEAYDVMTAKISCKTGAIDWSLLHPLLSAPIHDISIAIETSGSLSLNGNAEESPFVYTSEVDEPRYSFDIKAGEADVSISSLSFTENGQMTVDDTDTYDYTYGGAVDGN